MNVISFFGREYTGVGQLADKASEILGFRVVKDRDVIITAAKKFGLDPKQLETSVYKDPPLPGHFTPAKAQCIAGLKTILAREVEKGQVIFSGFLGELVPSDIGLHLLVTASDNFRLRRLDKKKGKSTNPADLMNQCDEDFLRWSLYLKTVENHKPWAYDGVVNVSKTRQAQLIEVISKAARKKEEAKGQNKIQERTPEEFRLAARVSRLMAEKGHPVAVSARGNKIKLKVNKPVLLLSWYNKKLSALAKSVNGVGKVNAQVGPLFHRSDISMGLEFIPPERVAWKPIEKAYNLLYSQVADAPQSFLRQHETPALSAGSPTP